MSFLFDQHSNYIYTTFLNLFTCVLLHRVTTAQRRSRTPRSRQVGVQEIKIKKFKLSQLNDSKLNLLRLLLVWTNGGNYLRFCPRKPKADLSCDELKILSPEFTEYHARDLFPFGKGFKWEFTKFTRLESNEYTIDIMPCTQTFALVDDTLNFACQRHSANNSDWRMHFLPFMPFISYTGGGKYIIVLAVPFTSEDDLLERMKTISAIHKNFVELHFVKHVDFNGVNINVYLIDNSADKKLPQRLTNHVALGDKSGLSAVVRNGRFTLNVKCIPHCTGDVLRCYTGECFSKK